MTASDPLITRFARACGARSPLDLQVDLGEERILARGKVHQSFTLVGRDDSCDVTLTDPGVHLRHCWLQVIEGRVFCVDLGTRSGVVWPSGETGPGWLEPEIRLGIGPFRLQMRSAPDPSAAPLAFHPLHSDSGYDSVAPPVELEFHNARRGRDRWSVNRVITLIGSGDDCKIHLNAQDVAYHHCGLVMTREGPWVVDLSGRGVLVNGERMRVAPLPPGAELRVARFVMSTRWDPRVRLATTPTPPPASTPTPPPTRKTPVRPLSSSRISGTPPPTEVREVPQLFAEDEVPIGGVAFSQSTSGLPSSHIMCDAFRADSTEQTSSSVLVGEALPSKPSLLPPAPARTDGPRPAVPGAMTLAPGLSIMLKQLGDIYDYTVEQLQQSVVMLVDLCGRLLPDQAPAVLWELTRIQELNAEMARLQGELARVTLHQVIGTVTAPARTGNDPSHGDATPPPIGSPLGAGAAADLLPEWIQSRISVLQEERQTRWRILADLLGHARERDRQL